MLFYSKKHNQLLDIFERVTISRRFKIILDQLNKPSLIYKHMTCVAEGPGIAVIYDYQHPENLKIILFLSDQKDLYRIGDRKEKVYSSHINIYNPVLKSMPYAPEIMKFQTLRPFLYYKRMKLPLGKIRVSDFKKLINRSA